MPTLIPPSSATPSSSAPADPLAGLRDIHLPDDISTLPIAPGWWLLAALLLTAGIMAVVLYRRWRQQQQYRRDGAQLLQQLQCARNASDSEQLQGINQLLKRVALVAYPNTAVASYYGGNWLLFLQQTAPNLPQPPELAEILNTGLYSPAPQTREVAILNDYARAWIRQHLPERKLTLSTLTLSTEAGHAAL